MHERPDPAPAEQQAGRKKRQPRVIGSALNILMRLWYWQEGSIKRLVAAKLLDSPTASLDDPEVRKLVFCWARVEEIGGHVSVGLERRQVGRHLKRLEKLGCIRIGDPYKDDALYKLFVQLIDAGVIPYHTVQLNHVYYVLVDPKRLDEHIPQARIARQERQERQKQSRRQRGKSRHRPDQPSLFDASAAGDLNKIDPPCRADDSPALQGVHPATTLSHHPATTLSHTNGIAPLEEELRTEQERSQEQQQGEHRAVAAVRNASEKQEDVGGPEQHAAARLAMVLIGIWETEIDRLLLRGGGLCLLAVALGRESGKHPAKFARRCIEQPVNFGVHRLPAWDADDPFAGWRCSPSDSAVGRQLAARDRRAAEERARPEAAADQEQAEARAERMRHAAAEAKLAAWAWENATAAERQVILAKNGGGPLSPGSGPESHCHRAALRLLRSQNRAPRSPP